MINEDNLVHVKFFFTNFSTDRTGVVKQKIKDYMIEREVAEDMLYDFTHGAWRYPYATIFAKRFSNGTWIDTFETIVMSNVAWIEWPIDLDVPEYEDEPEEDSPKTWEC